MEIIPENMLDDSGYSFALKVGEAENISNSAMNFFSFRIARSVQQLALLSGIL